MRKRDKAAVLDRDLKAMFRTLESRVLPDRVRCVVDQIYASEEPLTVKKSA